MLGNEGVTPKGQEMGRKKMKSSRKPENGVWGAYAILYFYFLSTFYILSTHLLTHLRNRTDYQALTPTEIPTEIPSEIPVDRDLRREHRKSPHSGWEKSFPAPGLRVRPGILDARKQEKVLSWIPGGRGGSPIPDTGVRKKVLWKQNPTPPP